MAQRKNEPADALPRRKPRTDALRNRRRILEIAKEAFTRLGADASLDDIAKRAEVGPGTLYRHFPTRDALIEAVYRSEVEKLAAAAQKYAQNLPPLAALQTWLLLFVDYVAAKHIIAPALNSVAGGATKLYEGSRPTIHEALEKLVKRGIRSGDLRKDLEAGDLLGALTGLAFMGAEKHWKRSATRVVEILIAGARRT
ncbi:MAG TPA: TetR/AcrR family transcriptional regulator [Terracidiphilus sp.]|jgi:AcrR family transcriptional regulator